MGGEEHTRASTCMSIHGYPPAGAVCEHVSFIRGEEGYIIMHSLLIVTHLLAHRAVGPEHP